MHTLRPLLKKRDALMSATLSLLLFGSACGPAEIGGVDTPDPTDEQVTHEDHALFSVGTRAQIAQQANLGDIELRPESAFRGVLLHITSFQRFQLEIAYEKLDGSRTDFFPVEPDEPEYPYANAQAILPEPANAIFVRVVEGKDDIEFLAARFFEEVPEGGVLDVHMDDYDPLLDEGGVAVEDEFDTTAQRLILEQALGARWIPSAEALAGGNQARFSYEDAPAWNPSACGGSFLAGTRDLAEYLVKNFGATHYGGYSCRQNTANRSKMSVHGTGRAIDLHYNTIGGDADNRKGDPTANWLLTNAAKIGVQLVIWDQSIWSVSRHSQRPYTGPVPHVDHLHIEVTSSAARRQTEFYRDPSVATSPSSSGGSSNPDTSGGGQLGGGTLGGGGTSSGGGTGGGTSSGATCMSSTLGRRVPSGSCVQMAYVKYGGRCNWATCSSSGYWVQAGSQCSSQAHANPTCGGSNPLPSGNTGGGGTNTDPGMNGSMGDPSTGNLGMTPAGVDGDLLGPGSRLTYYYIELEKDYPGTKNVPLKDCSGGEIAKVTQGFLDAVKLEGTGKLEDGRVVNTGSSNGCFQVLDKEKFPWGMGNRNNALEPLRSIAASTQFIFANNMLVYIKEFDGVAIPEVEGVGGFTHDGCFRVDDTGSGLTIQHVDFFAGPKALYKELEKLVPSNIEPNLYIEANTKCAAYKK